MFGERRIPSVGGTATNSLSAQAIWQVAGTDNFNPIGEYHQTNRCAGEVVPMN